MVFSIDPSKGTIRKRNTFSGVNGAAFVARKLAIAVEVLNGIAYRWSR